VPLLLHSVAPAGAWTVLSDPCTSHRDDEKPVFLVERFVRPRTKHSRKARRRRFTWLHRRRRAHRPRMPSANLNNVPGRCRLCSTLAADKRGKGHARLLHLTRFPDVAFFATGR
jgi:hypothetical protein